MAASAKPIARVVSLHSRVVSVHSRKVGGRRVRESRQHLLRQFALPLVLAALIIIAEFAVRPASDLPAARPAAQEIKAPAFVMPPPPSGILMRTRTGVG
jgi:hypothetical protein